MGLIPAHAGKTRPSTSPRPRFKAHSRSCGENAATPVFAMPPSGSSPLTRGKRCMILLTGRPVRLIPAHAGKTESRFGRRRRLAAHPRSRGENDSQPIRSVIVGGSSPLTRGKLALHKPDCGALLAHPRSRGENANSYTVSSAYFGSSPLTRGKHPHERSRAEPRGLIPAHAGKTPARPPTRASRTAHPRSRGENPRRRSRRGAVSGSSPLTRGKPPHIRDTHENCRLIPAHAGKT